MVMPWRAAYARRSPRVRRLVWGGGAAAGRWPGGRLASALAVRLAAWLTVVASMPSRAPVSLTGRFRWARSRVAIRGPAGAGVAELLAVAAQRGLQGGGQGVQGGGVQAGQRGVVQGGRVAQPGRGRRRRGRRGRRRGPGGGQQGVVP